MDEAKLEALVQAGLDHFQLSFQGAREETANEISGTKSHQQKLRVLEWLKRHRIGLTLHKLDAVLEGTALDELIDALITEHQASALATMDEDGHA